MPSTTIAAPVYTPPAPPLAPGGVGDLGVLLRLRRNAFSAFPARCFPGPAVRLPLPGRDLVIAGGPEAMREVLSSRTELYGRLDVGRRILGPILGRGLASSEGEAWRRRARFPAFATRQSRAPLFRLRRTGPADRQGRSATPGAPSVH